MAENTIQSLPSFSLGEELPPLSFAVCSSDDMEEGPLSKRLKVDDEPANGEAPSPALESERGKEIGVPLEALDAGGRSSVDDHEAGDSSQSGGSDQSGSEDQEKEVRKEKIRKRRKSKVADPNEDDEEDEGDSKKETGGGEKKLQKKKKSKKSHLRKNIREILTTDQLDEQTVAAQREEQERRARMNAKLQMQQQQNLLDMLNAGTSASPFGSHPHIDRLLARKGVSSAATTKTSASGTVIDEVVLSSDEEQPEIIPLHQGNGSSLKNGYGTSGGIVLDAVTPGESRVKEEATDTVESDSDDCVVLSPTEYHDEVDKDGNEDDNSVPDELGRVLVNVAHPPEDPDIFLAPQIARAVKPHQISGIRFLYDNVVESLDRFNTSNGFGCILAHSMGLGKTIQAISFCDVFLRHTRAKKVLIIVPINTIQNWLNEFDFWIPPQESNANSPSKLERKMSAKYNKKAVNETCDFDEASNEELSTTAFPLNSSSLNDLDDEVMSCSQGENNCPPDPEVRQRKFQVYVLGETVKTLSARQNIIEEWHFKGGVLLIGYEMFRMLALKRLKRSSKKKLAGGPFTAEGIQNQRAEEQSLNLIYEYLVKPGPDLVICDEGHRIKNSGASISQALKAIGTRRRVVLTGYPLQNNLMEYWCMVDFVRPNYLGSKTEFSNMFERPITNGQCVDSSREDKKLMRYRSHVLHTLLEGFVQRRSHHVLQSALPFKEEWVLLLKMTPVQYSLYKEFISYLKEEHRDKNSDRDGSPTANPIKAFAVCCKIWNHPDALYNVVKKQEDVLEDLDLDDVEGPEDGPKKIRKPRKNAKNTISGGSSADFTTTLNPEFYGLGIASMANIPATVSQVNSTSDGRTIRLEWALPVFKNYEAEVLENGVKFQVLFAMLEEIQTVGDRLLVFSQSLLTLDLIELFLAKKFQWKKNVQYFRLDGSTSALEREKLIKEFNDKDSVHLFLVSTRAGSLGINLIGANRVVVFDASWNPCHDAQAVCRVYRYGQKKECQIYRFVTDCSLEKRIYDRQINKRGMADRVVDEMNPETHLNTKDVSSFLVLDHNQMEKAQQQDVTHMFNMEKFTDPVLRNVLLRCGNRLTREPFEHESLLIDRKETKLSAKEKRQARQNYEMEKKQVTQSGFNSGYTYSRPSYAAYYPKTVTSTSPLIPSSLTSSNNYLCANSRSVLPSFSKSLLTDKKMMELRMQQQRRELPLNMLKERGIDCRFMILKKDAYLQDPSGGPEIFLNAGEKINIFRSNQGTYIRAATSNRFIAIKPTGNSNVFRGVPLTGDVTSEQLQSLVYSLLKPAHKKSQFFNPYMNSPTSYNNSSETKGWPASYHWSKPPPMQKLPPTSGIFPKLDNHQVLGIRSNQRDTSVLKNSPEKLPEQHSKSGNGSDVEIIEFEEHFGEVVAPQRVDQNMRMASNLAANNLPSFSQVRNTTKLPRPITEVPVPLPDMSIIPLPASNSFGKDPVPNGDVNLQLQNLMRRSVIRPSAGGVPNDSSTGSESSASWDNGSSGIDRSSQVAEEALDFLLGNCSDGEKTTDLPLSVASFNTNKDIPFWRGAANSPATFPEVGYRNDSVYNPSLALQNLLHNFGKPCNVTSSFGSEFGSQASPECSRNPTFGRLFDSSSSLADQTGKTEGTTGPRFMYGGLDFNNTNDVVNGESLQNLNFMPGQYYGSGGVCDSRVSESSSFTNMFQ